MKKIKVMIIFGTRPEAIKMAPLICELEKHSETIESIVVVTAQHREMLDQVLTTFNLVPDYDLNMMKNQQTLIDVTTEGLKGLDDVIKRTLPDMILVHGDTTTTFIASLAAFYNHIPIGHVEAGLRTYHKYAPYPEEINRQLTSILADLHFAPTVAAADHLRQEGKQDHIYVTGNTVIDALSFTIQEDYTHPVLQNIGDERFLLLTAHRRENLGEPLRRIFQAIHQLLDRHDDLHVIYPVHLNPQVSELAHEMLGDHPRIHLINPLDVVDFHNLAKKAYLILTDSGGVQEEAPSFGVPVLVLREKTERPEGVEAGVLKLVGTDSAAIVSEVSDLLTNKAAYQRMAQISNPYGDGEASKRIVDAILYYFNQTNEGHT